jgi:hypothetical protein
MKYLAPDFASPHAARERIASATDEELMPALWALAVLLGVDAAGVTKADLLRVVEGMIEREN